MPSGHYADVIERLRPGAASPGEIVDLDGHVLGSHDGIIHFTVGQRRGLGVATGAPLYVVRLDALRGASSLARARHCVPAASGCVKSTGLATARSRRRWPGRPEIYVKVRSTRPPQRAWLRGGADGSLEVELIGSEDGVSPGQGCAFYDAAEGQAPCWAAVSSPARCRRRRQSGRFRADLAAAH